MFDWAGPGGMCTHDARGATSNNAAKREHSFPRLNLYANVFFSRMVHGHNKPPVEDCAYKIGYEEFSV